MARVRIRPKYEAALADAREIKVPAPRRHVPYQESAEPPRTHPPRWHLFPNRIGREPRNGPRA